LAKEYFFERKGLGHSVGMYSVLLA
jgi:hypothetical protein